MISFECRFSTVGKVPAELLPPIPLLIPSNTGSASSLRDMFFFASGGVINLQPNYGFLSDGYESALDTVSGESLHSALSMLTQNPLGSYPVPRLGVLFAPSYGPREDVFGVMFDTGNADPDAPSSNVSTSPRAGCVIFLKTIKDLRPNDADYKKQVQFDIVHEIGHMFNLQHVDQNTGTCFLNVSPKDTVPESSAFAFLSFQRSILAECGIDRSVTPGGEPFGSGDLGNEDRPSNADTKSTRLTLTIDIAQKEFWAWEPVELDISLSLHARKPTQPLKIPDRLDPGYSSFEIWIEEPSDERRRYRSTKHYCANNADLKVDAKDQFRRDVSIFAESGGYTFRKAGLHKIWVNFHISHRRTLQSTPIKVMVKSRHLADSRAQHRLEETRRLLIIGARTLFYRSGCIRTREVAALEEVIARERGEHSGAAASYALGRLFYDQTRRQPKMRKEWIKKAQPYLETATDHSALSENRRRRATEIVRQIGKKHR